MTMPPMQPSAQERVRTKLLATERECSESGAESPFKEGFNILAFCHLVDGAQEAYRDGFLAAVAMLGVGEIVMMSEQRNKPGLPPRWCALARGRKEAAIGDTEQEARINALAIPVAAKLGDKT